LGGEGSRESLGTQESRKQFISKGRIILDNNNTEEEETPENKKNKKIRKPEIRNQKTRKPEN
jgi:hypothetical protein